MRPPRRWRAKSIALIVLAWLILHVGCLFTPGLLDDVDSIYIEIAREMLVRQDYVTPYVDGIRFFDKPPLMYWMAAGSMHVLGVHDWAARLPLALLTLGLLLAVYALGLRMFADISPAHQPDRGALYSALALVTCIGPFLYTRFFIPDVVVCLWMTLGVHAFLVALGRIQAAGTGGSRTRAGGLGPSVVTEKDANEKSEIRSKSALLPCVSFAAVTALNILTKGLIGLVFPIGFVLLYVGFTRQWRLLRKLHVIPSTLVFLAIAAPWHILAAVRNPAIALPAGLGLPAQGGWAWFYLYNEHIARFLSRRIPHDYGQVPVLLFWLLAALWIFPWTAFLPAAVAGHIRSVRRGQPIRSANARGTPATTLARRRESAMAVMEGDRQTSLTMLLWGGIVLGFFTFSARQEYYSLPAIPALALMAGGLLARADRSDAESTTVQVESARSVLFWHGWLLVPLGWLIAAVAIFFAVTAPATDPRTDIVTLLAQGGDYNLSLSHIFDLTGAAMGLFRGPLAVVGLSMITIGPLAYMLRRRGRTYAANLALAAAATALLLCVHEGLVRFYPTLGSRALADAILVEQSQHPAPVNQQPDLILIDGELTAGSSLIFYTGEPVHLVNGRMNGPWYGSFWPDAPSIFETDATLERLWASPRRIFLLTYHPAERTADLGRFGPVHSLAAAGGKSILTNH